MASGLKKFIRDILPWKVFRKLKRNREEWRVMFSDKTLSELAVIYNTDKSSHQYPPIYEQWFAQLRMQPLKLLEIGVGGYAREQMGGESLRMWKKYFPKGQITGLDIYDKSDYAEERIRIYQGDQSDKNFLIEISRKEGPFDVIIDDGSHKQSDIIASFEILFPLMASGGIYVIEDTQTSYWPKYGGSSSEMDTVHSAMNYFISRVNEINYVEWRKEEVTKEFRNEGIASIAFYHNLIFVMKK